MTRTSSRFLVALAAAGAIGASLAYTPVSYAFNFGDMMNPGRWMGGGNRDRYDDDYYGGPYGEGPWGGPYGGGPWGGGPYGGPGFGGPYGAPGYGGYGAPPVGYGAPAPAYSAPAPAAAAPKESTSSNTKSAEIEALKRRIDELEAKQQAPAYAPPPSDWGTTPSTPSTPSTQDWGSAPAFRPMGKY